MNKYVLLLLVHDFLFGNGVKCGGPLKQMMMKHKTRLNAELVKLKVRKGVKDNKDLKSEDVKSHLAKSQFIPRHVRVNTLKISVQDAIEHFKSVGYEYIGDCGSGGSDNVSIEGKQFGRDSLIEQLLIFPRRTDFHLDPLFKSGSIILQEKASCFPPVALNPPPGSSVIDACAAPGNKTSFISALMENTGTVYALDMDPKRARLLHKNMDKAGCVNVNVLNRNFLELNPADYEDVKYILLDPSCSGSGIVSRMDGLVDKHSAAIASNNGSDNAGEEESKSRILQLAQFQKSVIMHAMTFPNVERIVYSTCSIHVEENEQVVSDILADEKCSRSFELAEILPKWHRRGLQIADDNSKAKQISQKVVRCMPEDGTNGFFVSCFQRISQPLYC